MSDGTIELQEDRVPLSGIDETAVEVVELYGGRVESSSAGSIRFFLPHRRGVAAGGGVECSLAWSSTGNDLGTVTLRAGREIDAPKLQHVAILVVGMIGALLWLLWPFFPNLGTLSWIGGALAFAAYFLTLKRTPTGTASDLLHRLARAQRELAEGEGSGEG